MAMTDLTIIRRSMFGRLFSTVTTAITVAVAVALMLTLLSMRDSGRQAFERGTGNMHLLISRDSSPLVSVLNGVFYADPPARPIDRTKFDELSRLPASFMIPVQQGDSYLGMPVLATTQEFFTRFSPDPDFNPDLPADAANGSPWRFREGRPFERSFEVVFGARAAADASIRLGDRITLTHGTEVSRKASERAEQFAPHVHDEYEYEVVGILEPTGSAHDRAVFSDLTSSWIIHAHDRRKLDDPAATTTEADLLPEDMLITGIYYRAPTRGGSNVSSFLPQVGAQLRADPTITVAQPKEEIDSLFSIVSNIDQILIGMAAAVMVSSGIAIMLALYNSMEQRRRQVAVLRVLGCSRGRVFGLVVTESAMIGLAGALIGLIGGVLGSTIVAGTLRARLGIVVDPVFDPRLTLAVVLATVLLASVAGLVPAAVAYRTSVVKNLRPIG
ncbi:MAG: ABC transporter permease [Phycisphaerales bacterium]